MFGEISEGICSYPQDDVCRFKNLTTLSLESSPYPVKVLFTVKPTLTAQSVSMDMYGLGRSVTAFLIPDMQSSLYNTIKNTYLCPFSKHTSPAVRRRIPEYHQVVGMTADAATLQ